MLLSTWYKLDTSLYSITNNTSRTEIISDCSQNSKPPIKHVSRFCHKSLSQIPVTNPCHNKSTQGHTEVNVNVNAFASPPLILPNHHLKSLSIHQAPLSATIRRKALDKLRRPRMRIRPHHAQFSPFSQTPTNVNFSVFNEIPEQVGRCRCAYLWL